MMPHRNMHGILNVNKPEGLTSFQIITWLRRLSGEQRIGHTGTLDPCASGVLPVLFGQATKISRFLSISDKVYYAVIELGISTDTYDRDGKVIAREKYDKITAEQVREALSTLQGYTEQVPPLYSAIKYQGKKYYQLTRKGIHITPKPRKINIIKLELVQFKLPLMTLNIECSSGTYIRSLAYDLGQKLGCGAYLKNLVRTRSGVFCIENALSQKEIETAFSNNSCQALLYAIDYAFTDWDSVVLDERNQKLLKDGNALLLEEAFPPAKLLRGYDPEGKLVALLKYNQSSLLWQHEILFSY